ncbi:Hypothetical protein FKW44_013574 [Caligus rogercresseyi]|uniref:Uncharacterized protein n=1 Tax=Caligus rogercresseyi TaxID=217165 RepID=A0A7T8JZT0_CALRO|nr:Hypothetical protein FKW44_013574 [Caligus rogercresseyi]
MESEVPSSYSLFYGKTFWLPDQGRGYKEEEKAISSSLSNCKAYIAKQLTEGKLIEDKN